MTEFLETPAWCLPEVAATPCIGCPWRRDSMPGHLGPHDAEGWIEAAHSDVAIACHVTLKRDGWDQPTARQCAGAAQFRTNVFKRPRSSLVAVADERDTEMVFGTNAEFINHHENGPI